MPWYPRVQQAINTLLLPVLLPTQAANLALVALDLLHDLPLPWLQPNML